jgi:branched-chain amino acid aminotransferase
MINFNEQILPKEELSLSYQNRAFKYGDAIFDTLKYENNQIAFLEEHYFRIMSSMRMLRMQIPMNFTLEYYEQEIIKVLEANSLKEKARIRVTVFRNDGGLYLPKTNAISFLMEASFLDLQQHETYEIELFKDFPVYSGLLSTIKTTNKMVHVLASIFASEYGYQNCVLINENKNVVEAMNANLFVIKNGIIITPPLTEGCLNGIIRKKVMELIRKSEKYKVEEKSISPFELLKVDEIFLTNSIIEIQSVTKYRKKNYQTKITEELKGMFEEIKVN